MATASLEQVTVHALLPRSLPSAAAERVRRALGEPLTQAVPDAFDDLEQVDPGAYWVLREVRARTEVWAQEPDPARSATAIARAMAAAVVAVVRQGPSADAVRFTDRAGYLAGYLRARLGAAGDGWVYERLRSLSALPPCDALPAGARLLEVGLLDAVTALVRAGDWERLLDAADRPATARLAGTVSRLADGDGPVDLDVLAAVAALRAVAPAAARRRTAAGRRLQLLGLRARQVPLSLTDVAAVWRLEPGDEDEPPGRAGSASWEEPTATDARGAPAASPPPAGREQHDGTDSSEPAVLRCAGAVAFLLLADLAEVLASEEAAAWLQEPEPEAGEIRAAALAAVLGRGIDRGDPAIRLAAGVETAPEEPSVSPDAMPVFSDPLLAVVHPADAEWFAPVHEQPGIEGLGRALARRFAAHLPGFGRVGLPYLAERVLPLGGTIRITDDAVLVDLPRPPLHVLLAMAGLDAFSCQVPWLDLPVLVTHEEDHR